MFKIFYTRLFFNPKMFVFEKMRFNDVNPNLSLLF